MTRSLLTKTTTTFIDACTPIGVNWTTNWGNGGTKGVVSCRCECFGTSHRQDEAEEARRWPVGEAEQVARAIAEEHGGD